MRVGQLFGIWHEPYSKTFVYNLLLFFSLSHTPIRRFGELRHNRFDATVKRDIGYHTSHFTTYFGREDNTR